MESGGRILVAVLNWGLGHATRSIPIIEALINSGLTPLIASDGQALALLKKEFPAVESIELPAYGIRYSKRASGFKAKLIKSTPKMLKAISREHKQIKKLIDVQDIKGIISDNRFGAYSKKVPSVFITHQLNVLSGQTTWISSKLHQKVIKKFDQCWVPDVKEEPSLSGVLGHSENQKIELRYLGVLSRFELQELPIAHDLLIILSGPEPQRSLLEDQLMSIISDYPKRILLVRGLIEDEQKITKELELTIYNFMQQAELEMALNSSAMVLCRSGYSSILDLAKLGKKAFLIPTPGQFEQEYLAERMMNLRIAPSCKQTDFGWEQLTKVEAYSGFTAMKSSSDLTSLFSLFKGK